MANTNVLEEKEKIEWSDSAPDDYRKWCHAGGRRYIFVDSVIENGKGYRGLIFDIDLDSFDMSEHYIDDDDAEYIKSQESDYDKAYAIADCIDNSSETELYATEEEMWQEVREMEI